MSIWTLLQEESEAKGRAQGLTEGELKGKMEERSAIISTLLKKLSVAEIAKLLEISEEEVRAQQKPGE